MGQEFLKRTTQERAGFWKKPRALARVVFSEPSEFLGGSLGTPNTHKKPPRNHPGFFPDPRCGSDLVPGAVPGGFRGGWFPGTSPLEQNFKKYQKYHPPGTKFQKSQKYHPPGTKFQKSQNHPPLGQGVVY